MTCLIGIRTADDRLLVACDSRVSWTDQAGGMVTDNLQKLYPLGPDVLCAVCGLLVPAKATLRLARSEVERLADKSAAPDGPQWLNALLRHKWMQAKGKGSVHLLVASRAAGESSLFIWKPPTKQPTGPRYNWPRVAIEKGATVVLGSVENDEGLVSEIGNSFRLFAVPGTVSRLSDDQLAMIVCDKLHQLFADGKGEPVGVGGLFQVATWSEQGCFFHGYETSMVDTAGIASLVELRFDGARWLQRNSLTGQEVALRSMEDTNLHALPRSPVRFVWTRRRTPSPVTSAAPEQGNT